MRPLLAALTALLALASVAGAHPGTREAQLDLAPPLIAPPLSAKGVEFVKNIPTQADTPGGRLHDGFFYLTTERDLVIYDVKDAANPVEVGRLLWGRNFETPYFPEEDVDTNGKILITSNKNAIEVYDVADKRNPKLLSTLAGSPQHTISCVLDCTWAYGSAGSIVDLRDPAAPKLAGSWTSANRVTQTHDVTEVAPGMVLTASQPVHLLDARDPAKPKSIATRADAGHFQHATLWPRKMADRFALVGGEASGPNCAMNQSATFQTYDMRGFDETKQFKLADRFRVLPGNVVDGRAPDSTYCVHWFDTHPSYKNGGLVAISWYEHGTRLVDIDGEGKITEVGHVLSPGSSASAAYWISKDIFYVADYNRGLDVFRYTGKQPGAKG